MLKLLSSQAKGGVALPTTHTRNQKHYKCNKINMILAIYIESWYAIIIVDMILRRKKTPSLFSSRFGKKHSPYNVASPFGICFVGISKKTYLLFDIVFLYVKKYCTTIHGFPTEHLAN